MKRKEGKHKESGTDLISYTVKSGVAPVQHSYKVRENYMTKADLNVKSYCCRSTETLGQAYDIR